MLNWRTLAPHCRSALALHVEPAPLTATYVGTATYSGAVAYPAEGGSRNDSATADTAAARTIVDTATPFIFQRSGHRGSGPARTGTPRSPSGPLRCRSRAPPWPARAT